VYIALPDVTLRSARARALVSIRARARAHSRGEGIIGRESVFTNVIEPMREPWLEGKEKPPLAHLLCIPRARADSLIVAESDESDSAIW